MKITARNAISFFLLLKAMAGFGMATLALFGVTMPHIGIQPTFLSGSVAASVGAGIGVLVALKG